MYKRSRKKSAKKSRKKSRSTKSDILKKIERTFGGKEKFIKVENNMLGSNYNLGYGEMTQEAMENIIKVLKDMRYQMNTYIDIGSGSGRTLAYAMALGFKKAKGIEIVDKRYKHSLKMLSKFPFSKNIEVSNGDMFDLQKSFFDNNCVVFISNLLFPKETTAKLIEFLDKNIEHGVVILTTIPDNLHGFILKDKIPTPMSWYEQSLCHILYK